MFAEEGRPRPGELVWPVFRVWGGPWSWRNGGQGSGSRGVQESASMGGLVWRGGEAQARGNWEAQSQAGGEAQAGGAGEARGRGGGALTGWGSSTHAGVGSLRTQLVWGTAGRPARGPPGARRPLEAQGGVVRGLEVRDVETHSRPAARRRRSGVSGGSVAVASDTPVMRGAGSCCSRGTGNPCRPLQAWGGHPPAGGPCLDPHPPGREGSPHRGAGFRPLRRALRFLPSVTWQGQWGQFLGGLSEVR